MTRQQDSVGLTAFDTAVRLDMPARSSPRHFHEMMNQLESLQASQTTDVAETLHLLANRFKRRCLVVLISDLYDEPDAVVRALHHFRPRRHEVILFHVLDKAEIEFPFREVMLFRDLETGQRIQVDPSYVRQTLPGANRGFLGDLSPGVRKAQIDYVLCRHVDSLRLHALPIPFEAEPAMTFLAPLFLLAALAGIIPIART